MEWQKKGMKSPGKKVNLQRRATRPEDLTVIGQKKEFKAEKLNSKQEQVQKYMMNYQERRSSFSRQRKSQTSVPSKSQRH